MHALVKVKSLGTLEGMRGTVEATYEKSSLVNLGLPRLQEIDNEFLTVLESPCHPTEPGKR
jgi:hypothetical protein